MPTHPVPASPVPALDQPTPQAPTAPQVFVGQQLNWSHFRPKFTGKPEEDVEAHHLHINDWMSAHKFLGGVRIQRVCLTLIGEARLWFESLRPIVNDWQALQEQFRQQYSKIGNTREQLFHA